MTDELANSLNNAMADQAKLEALEAENKRLREALEYYAHPDHYATRSTLSNPGVRGPGVLVDAGDIARAALKEGETLIGAMERAKDALAVFDQSVKDLQSGA